MSTATPAELSGLFDFPTTSRAGIYSFVLTMTLHSSVIISCITLFCVNSEFRSPRSSNHSRSDNQALILGIPQVLIWIHSRPPTSRLLIFNP
jgi:hypothetical protein